MGTFFVAASLVSGFAATAPAQVPSQSPAGAAFGETIAKTEARLLASGYSRSSPRALARTEEAVAGLVDAAWEVAGQVGRLQTPTFAAARTIVGRPGLFNPDNKYLSVVLDPAGAYRIKGRRGTHSHFTIQILDAYPLIALGKNLQVLGDEELQLKPGDSFEISLGGTPRVAHWWPMPAGARTLLVRETFGDWSNETPTDVSIERVDSRTQASEPGPSWMARAADYLDNATQLWAGTYLDRLQQLPVNSLPPPSESRDGLKGQQSVMARFRLKTDEALIITVRASDAAYQGIQLGDPWFVTPDWSLHQCSLNARQARIDPDGMMRFVISVHDPGVPNWLDPDDNAEGYLFMRWQGLKQSLTAADAPRTELVPLSKLRRHLPRGTPVVDATARAQQVALRRVPPLLR